MHPAGSDVSWYFRIINLWVHTACKSLERHRLSASERVRTIPRMSATRTKMQNASSMEALRESTGLPCALTGDRSCFQQAQVSTFPPASDGRFDSVA